MKKRIQFRNKRQVNNCKLLFVMGDVGGTRAMLPIINAAYARGYDCHVLDCGHVSQLSRIDGVSYHGWGDEFTAHHLRVVTNSPADDKYSASDSSMEGRDTRQGFNMENALLNKVKPDIVVFATSVSDKAAVRVAYAATQQGIGTAHLLDYWANYTQRLELGQGLSIKPDLYAVMDDLAYHCALSAGVPASSLAITGGPAFESIANNRRFTRRHFNTEKPELVFVSEPVSTDYSDGSSCSENRGYTETSVLRRLLELLNNHFPEAILNVFPHPRENAQALEQFLNSVKGTVRVRLVSENDKESTLARSVGVIGMSSVLLYEAWMRGFPVLSLQPGLVLDSLRHLSGRPGLCFVDKPEELASQAISWLQDLGSHEANNPVAYRTLISHRSASALFLHELSVLHERRIRRLKKPDSQSHLIETAV